MAQEGLQIEIQANVQRAVQALKSLEGTVKGAGNSIDQLGTKSVAILNNQLERLQRLASNPNLSTNQYEKLNKLINQTSTSAKRLGDNIQFLSQQAGGKLTQGTNQANVALVNFGRVVQDAPFGLIGIANNIDPLLESFQRLKQQTGSSGAAFRALASSLAGPAGLAIAVSALTSALIAFGPEIQEAINKISTFDKITGEALGDAAKAAKTAQLDIERLTNIINDGAVSAERQKDALGDVNKLLNKYGLEIKTVADFQRIGGEVSQVFIQLKREEARAQFLAAQAAEQYAKQIQSGYRAQLLSRQGAINVNNPLDFFRAFNLQKNIKQIKESADLQNIFENEVKQSEFAVDKLIQKLKQIPGVYESFGKSTKGAKDKVEEFKQSLTAQTGVIAAVSNQIRQQNADLQEQILLLNRLTELGRERAGDVIQPQEPKAQNIDLLSSLSGGKSPLEQLDLLAGEFEKVKGKASELQGVIDNGINAGIDQFFNALANNQDPFAALQQSVKRLVAELAAAVIKTLILKAIANTIAPGSGSAIGGLQGVASGSGIVRGDFLRLATFGR
jgi:hypothetical protein